MPNTANYSFEYESPGSTPGTTLTGGPGGGSPILAPQVDSALAAVETKVDNNSTNITANAADLTGVASDVTDLTNWIQTGVASVSFTSQNSDTHPVSYGFTFPDPPNVHVNINSGAGETALWVTRAIQITASGFTIFLFSANAESDTWTDIEVAWTAIYRP